MSQTRLAHNHSLLGYGHPRAYWQQRKRLWMPTGASEEKHKVFVFASRSITIAIDLFDWN
jgi:hypothetical protein